MRGAYIVTLLFVSLSALMGCVTNGREDAPPNRPAKQPAGMVQEGVRWVVCGDTLACRPPTPKTMVTKALQPTLKPIIQPLSITSPDVISHDAARRVTIPQPVTPPLALTRVVVHFSHNSFSLDGIAQRVLDGLPATGVFKVRAYTDSTGSDRYNAWLSARRAERVKEYVIRQGVAPQRVRIEALGECCFVASNASPAGRAANRRVEIVISKPT